METYYYIVIDNKMQKVTHEEYNKFKGDKYALPSTWKLCIIHQLLLPLRWRYNKYA